MESMTSTVASAPADFFPFDSVTEDYEVPNRAQAALVLFGAALLAVPVGIVTLAAAPFVLGARALRR